jgi:DNA invertase Pin-like site-specific DNA recombinase
MPTYGYARVSTIDQDLSLQRRTLKASGCDVIRAEKASGTRRSGRNELQVLLDFLRPGDTLVVTRVDRLARSIRDLQDIVHELRERGVTLKATEQPIDTVSEVWQTNQGIRLQFHDKMAARGPDRRGQASRGLPRATAPRGERGRYLARSGSKNASRAPASTS